jgi:hypothetical protein
MQLHHVLLKNYATIQTRPEEFLAVEKNVAFILDLQTSDDS